MDAIEYLRNKYDYMEEGDIEFFVSAAKEVLINTLYPFDPSIDPETFVVPRRYENWIIRAAIEMIERAGVSSAVAYNENGIGIQYGRAQISSALIGELTPKAGIIKT